MKETILLYNIMQQEWADLYRTICRKQNIELKMISEEEYAVPIGYLAYGTEEQKAEYLKESRKAEGQESAVNEPMMVFGGFTGQRLMEMLKLFREKGLPGIGLKAMMTEHNAVWDSVTLYGQLAEERDQFARMKEQQEA